MNEIHVLSLGAGVQSSALALMATHGQVKPMPAFAIFADTGAEPEFVYRWLDWLETQLAYPVYRVSHGNLGSDSLVLRTSASGKRYTKFSVPAFIRDAASKQGLLKRQCTESHKIEVIQRELNRRRQSAQVVQWIGISRDEAHRMKPARKPWITNRYPLIDKGIYRQQCIEWMRDHGYPSPPRSACVFCPYRSRSEWKRLKDEAPQDFLAAVRYERELQSVMSHVSGFRGTPWLHRSCRPLDTVDFEDEADSPQSDMFGNECEGLCGV